MLKPTIKVKRTGANRNIDDILATELIFMEQGDIIEALMRDVNNAYIIIKRFVEDAWKLKNYDSYAERQRVVNRCKAIEIWYDIELLCNEEFNRLLPLIISQFMSCCTTLEAMIQYLLHPGQLQIQLENVFSIVRMPGYLETLRPLRYSLKINERGVPVGIYDLWQSNDYAEDFCDDFEGDYFEDEIPV